MGRPLFGPLVDIGHSMPGRMLGLAVTVSGLGLLAWAWIELVRLMTRTAGARSARPLRQVWTATLAWGLPLLIAPPLFSRDGWSYAAQGAMTLRGHSPYDFGPMVLSGPIVDRVDPRWLDTPAPYGPLPLLWGALSAGVTEDPWLLVIAHRLAAVVGLALLAWALPRLAGWTRHDPAVVCAVVLPSPLIFAHGVGGLHNDLLVVGLAAAALVVANSHGWVAGAALGGLSAAVKLPGGLICIAVALVTLPTAASLYDRLVRLTGVAVVSVVTLVGVGRIAGVGSGWVHTLGVPAEIRTPLSLSTQVGRLLEAGFRLLELRTLFEASMPFARGLGTVLAIGVAIWVALRAKTGEPGAAVQAAATALTATFLLSPVVHIWYALWFVPFLAAVPLGSRVFNALLNFSLIAGLTAPLDSSLEGVWVAIGLTGALVIGVAVPLLVSTRGISLPQPVRHRVAVRPVRPLRLTRPEPELRAEV